MNPIAFRTSTYFQYISKRKTIQYIHSPFLFNLIENVFDDTVSTRPVSFRGIEMTRKELQKNDQVISFEDYGAGGEKQRFKQIAVSAIAKKSLKQAKYARFLHRLVRYTKSKTVVELGTSFGLTTLYLSAAVEPDGKVCTVEADIEVKKIAEKNWNESLGINNIESHCFDLDEKWSWLAEKIGKIDFLFVDANHRKEAMIKYVEQAIPFLHERSVIVMDDIHWSEGALEAWNILKGRGDVTLSFDIYQMGVLFFDKNLSKEDFTLKY